MGLVTHRVWLDSHSRPLLRHGDRDLSYLLTRFIPLLALFYGTAVIREEIEDQTLTYSFSRPVPRQWIYGARMLAAACPLLLLGLGPVLYISSQANGMHMLSIVGVTFLSSVCFCGAFGLLGQLTRRPAWIGLVYLIVWEVVVSKLPGLISRFTLTAHIESAAQLGQNKLFGKFAVETVDQGTAWLVLSVTAIGLLALGGAIAARRSFQIPR